MICKTLHQSKKKKKMLFITASSSYPSLETFLLGLFCNSMYFIGLRSNWMELEGLVYIDNQLGNDSGEW